MRVIEPIPTVPSWHLETSTKIRGDNHEATENNQDQRLTYTPVGNIVNEEPSCWEPANEGEKEERYCPCTKSFSMNELKWTLFPPFHSIPSIINVFWRFRRKRAYLHDDIVEKVEEKIGDEGAEKKWGKVSRSLDQSNHNHRKIDRISDEKEDKSTLKEKGKISYYLVVNWDQLVRRRRRRRRKKTNDE